MCGIVGYIGKRDSVPILMDGLRRLEYRGYDSAGLAVLNHGDLKVVRRKGKLAELSAALDSQAPAGLAGIGHTRWATHGQPSEPNAHPHLDCTGKIAVVHNGIIENFSQLRDELAAKGHVFKSETDTETISHLVEEYYDGDLYEAVRAAVKRVKGSFAIAVLSSDHPDELIAARKDSPLILGLGEGEQFIASDIPAVISHTKRVLVLDDGEMARVTEDGCTVRTIEGSPVDRTPIEITWDDEAAEKGGFDDFMLKEIYEQPVAVRETLRPYLKDGSIVLGDDFALSDQAIRALDKVFIVACGTSYHAALVGKRLIEQWAGISVEVDVASEFRYRHLLVGKGSLIVAITQSGETADTLASMKVAKKCGAHVVAISNVVGSTATRQADGTVYTHAGPEIGVAATKTFVSQLAAVYALSLYLAGVKGSMGHDEVARLNEEMRSVPTQIEQALGYAAEIREAAKEYASCRDFLFLGRGIGLPIALEGALKLKEISYIHAEGYAAGEMKHGPIALIDENCPVVVVATDGPTYEKVISNVLEVRARGASVIAVATEGNSHIQEFAEHVFYVPRTLNEISAIPAAIPLQLLAYFIAKERGCDVDQPRNLAKSVTVE
ncbi:MAG: glutamine--fructose-6-phosphate transaminase (isomerizing) [Chloroflexi bacterium]|nr:glutamine--fructose-6-phosphate transaminase (isomerizing) [Chloroflexota bacterium]